MMRAAALLAPEFGPSTQPSERKARSVLDPARPLPERRCGVGEADRGARPHVRAERACAAKLGDVNMLARTGGRNRTQIAYRARLQSGSFQVTGVPRIRGDLALLESRALR